MGEVTVTERKLKKGTGPQSMRTEVKIQKVKGERLELAYVAQALNMAHEKGAPADATVVSVDWTETGIAFELTWGPEMTKNELALPPQFDYRNGS